MAEKFGGGPCGLDTLAATINEDSNTIEDVYEPYLLQMGFVARTPRGRILLRKGYEHIGLKLPEGRAEQYSVYEKSEN
jgi:Holliday junction DNA helicase RuvB